MGTAAPPPVGTERSKQSDRIVQTIRRINGGFHCEEDTIKSGPLERYARMTSYISIGTEGGTTCPAL